MHSVAYVATLTQDCSSMPPLPDCYRLHHKYPAACPSCLLWHAEMSIGTILSMWLIVQVQRAHQAVYCRNNVMLFWVKIGMALLKPGMGSFPHKHCLFCYAATFNATIKLFFHVCFFSTGYPWQQCCSSGVTGTSVISPLSSVVSSCHVENVHQFAVSGCSFEFHFLT